MGYLVVGRLLQHLRFEIQPLDPISFVGAGLILLGVGAVACYLPARRATRIDPMVALRDE